MAKSIEAPFYMVYVTNGQSPTVMHRTRTDAEVEAQRLARISGQKVTVLASVVSFKKREFEVLEYGGPDVDLPF